MAQQITYELVTGNPFVPPSDFYNQTCLTASKSFPGLLQFGTFATEVGCQYDGEGDSYGAIWDCVRVASANTIAKQVLQEAGWTKATPAVRTKLAWAWLREVDKLDVEDDRPDMLPASAKFQPPIAIPQPDGGIELTFWYGISGMGMTFVQAKASFAADGTPSPVQTLAQVEATR